MKAVIGLYSDGHYEIILYAQASLSSIPLWINLPGGKIIGTGFTNVGTTDAPKLSQFNDGFIKIFNYNRHTKISALFSHYLHRQENIFHLFQPNLPKSWRVIDIPNSEGLKFSSLKIPWYKFPGYFSNTYRTFYFLVTAVLQRLDPSQYQTDNIVLEKKREHNDDAFAFLASIHQKYAYKLAK